MDLWQATTLGLVEGLTEFLPVSSTGHLILAGKILGLDEGDAALKAFDIIIQGAAMLAVILVYWTDIVTRVKGVMRQDPEQVKFAMNFTLAVFPALLLGFLFAKKIKTYLFGSTPVLIALILGGIFIIIFEQIARRKARNLVQMGAKGSLVGQKQTRVQDLEPRQALSIGLFQCAALWPGTSRSMSTILGARWIGLPAVDAAYFSFLMAIPVLVAATGYDLLKNHALFSQLGSEYWVALGVGSLVSFVVALVVIKTFLRFLRNYSLEVFGWYRVVAGIVFWLTVR